MNGPSARPIEGTDYYLENGKWVFTAAYHRKRGYCCKSGCRHCPFGNAPADREGPPAEPPGRTHRDPQ